MKVIIVGGVAGGASCAARLRRLDEDAEIVMVEKGPYVSFANCGLPYHVGDVIEHESDLLVASERLFREHFRVDCRTGGRATGGGVTGYLLKAERPDELFAAIRDAAAGRTALSAPVADRLLAQLRSPRPTLSEREHEILGQLARGLGNREIARALFISEATVKTHLGRIYGKLGVETRSGAVAVAKESRLLP
jgi:DNA-binding CsgD family transcriptional regulator